jgi:hypothetical protein
MKLSICAAALLLLVGCSAAPIVPTHPQTQEAAIKQSGGAFRGSYAGSYQQATCTTNGGSFSFSGSGSASFLHSSTEIGSLAARWDPIGGVCLWQGAAKLTSSLHPRNSISMQLAFVSDLSHGICPSMIPVTFSNVSGTGRFKNAAGSGSDFFKCRGGHSGAYTDTWRGTITF